MIIDINKTYRYRNGEPARIICVDRPHVTHKVISMSEKGFLEFHLIDGTRGDDEFPDYDLIECKEKKTLWVAVYQEYQGIYIEHDKPELSNDLVARIKVEYEKGRFDE